MLGKEGVNRSSWFQAHNSVILQGWKRAAGVVQGQSQVPHPILTVTGAKDLSNMEDRHMFPISAGAPNEQKMEGQGTELL